MKKADYSDYVVPDKLFMLQTGLVNFISALLETAIEYSALFCHDPV